MGKKSKLTAHQTKTSKLTLSCSSGNIFVQEIKEKLTLESLNKRQTRRARRSSPRSTPLSLLPSSNGQPISVTCQGSDCKFKTTFRSRAHNGLLVAGRMPQQRLLRGNFQNSHDEAVQLKKGAVKKKLHDQPQKKKGGPGGSANAPHCARSASDPRTRPFFPLSATKALRTTALVLFSQGFGCPTVVQDLSKRVQWSGRELSYSAIIVCGRPACSESETFRFFSPGWRRRSRCSIRCPVHALDFHHFGKPREDKVRFVRVLQTPPLPLPLKSRVCRCLQSVRSPWGIGSVITSDLWPSSYSALPQVSSKKAKWEISEMGWSSVPLPCHQHCHWVLLCAGVSKICRKNLCKSGCRTPLKNALMSFL